MDTVVASALNYGAPGIVIAGLLFAVMKLWSRYDDIQEKRIAESRESIKAIEQNTASLETLAEVLKERRP